MEVDSTESVLEEHADSTVNEGEPMKWKLRPLTPQNHCPSDHATFNASSKITSMPYSTPALPQETSKLSEYLQLSTELQMKNNQLLTIHAANSERFNQELLTRFDNVAPTLNRIMELAEDNLQGGSRRTSGQPANPTPQKTPRGGRLAVS